MCLDKIYNYKPKDSGVGWKVFYLQRGRLLAHCRGSKESRPVGEWLDEKDFRDSYLPPREGYGWHIFVDEASAMKWTSISPYVVRKVKYRGATATGLFLEFRNVVAKEIYICENKGKLS